jgi:hypothetical protein
MRNLPAHDQKNIEKETKQIERRCAVFGRMRNARCGMRKAGV